ncbi:MAG: HupE/UreJ family protein [Bacteroidetes bacterium]|nr:HupE/UreJ family protein [Bacteroidota bacterium]
MSEFTSYLELGLRHILNLKGMDHALFVMALCAPFELKVWKKLLILITAFTLGHSLTLVLSAMNIFQWNGSFTEQIIAATIAVTALQNLIAKKQSRAILQWKYGMAFSFGLIHGMGFSGYFKRIIGEESILLPLFSFNAGIELAQIVIILCLFLIYFALHQSGRMNPRSWNMIISGMALGASLLLLSERF